jgi:hypothetical protein
LMEKKRVWNEGGEGLKHDLESWVLSSSIVCSSRLSSTLSPPTKPIPIFPSPSPWNWLGRTRCRRWRVVQHRLRVVNMKVEVVRIHLRPKIETWFQIKTNRRWDSNLLCT